jgi:hypothetical protein
LPNFEPGDFVFQIAHQDGWPVDVTGAEIDQAWEIDLRLGFTGSQDIEEFLNLDAFMGLPDLNEVSMNCDAGSGAAWETDSHTTPLTVDVDQYTLPSSEEDNTSSPRSRSPDLACTAVISQVQGLTTSVNPSVETQPSRKAIPRSISFPCPHCSVSYADNLRLQ